MLKFKQGIGRLIRTVDDRGVLILLDNRVIKKGYGKQFLDILPTRSKICNSVDSMVEDVEKFFC